MTAANKLVDIPAVIDALAIPALISSLMVFLMGMNVRKNAGVWRGR